MKALKEQEEEKPEEVVDPEEEEEEEDSCDQDEGELEELMMHVYFKKDEIEYTRERQKSDPFNDIMAFKKLAMADGL